VLSELAKRECHYDNWGRLGAIYAEEYRSVRTHRVLGARSRNSLGISSLAGDIGYILPAPNSIRCAPCSCLRRADTSDLADCSQTVECSPLDLGRHRIRGRNHQSNRPHSTRRAAFNRGLLECLFCIPCFSSVTLDAEILGLVSRT
jgi:hypothetical protein